MSDLSDAEKKRIVELALKAIQPIAEKYELDTETGRMALYQAFQEGVKFAAHNVKKVQEDILDGNA